MPTTLYTTARDTGQRIARQTISPSNDTGAPDLEVYSDHRFQSIHGFGGSFTPAAAKTWLKLPLERRAEFIRAYFHPTEGNAYTLGRLAIHSCDFSDGNWTYVTDEDPALGTFSIERDWADVIPLVRAAEAAAGERLRLMASPWSPPAWMKDNGRMCQGGSLLPQHYATWARYFVKYLQAYAAEGLPLWAITTQNETEAVTPWENCTYTGAQERDFVRDHLGPVLHAANLSGVRIYIYDHNRDRLIPHCQPILDDARAAAYVTGVAYHWYVQDKHDNLRLFHDTWPNKDILFTEACVELVNKAVYEGQSGLSGFGSDGEANVNPLLGRWDFAERYGRSLIEDFNRWNSGFIDWNLLLDEKGGPNHVNNYCNAPIMADTRDGTLYFQGTYYYIGHFSRFIRPGARRVLCSTAHDSLRATAFLNPDGSRVVVLLNDGDEPRTRRVAVDGEAFIVDMPPHSIATLVV